MTGAGHARDRAEWLLFAAGAILGGCGAALLWVTRDARAGISFLLGAGLSALNLAWLRAGVSALVLSDRRRSQRRVLAAFMARLLLIPLALYAMIRFLFLSLPAAAAGFAAFLCGALVVGIAEACGTRPGKHARAERNRDIPE